MTPLRFDRDLLLAPDVQLSRGVRVLINLPALRARRDGVEDTALRDARLDVLRDELVAITCDAHAGVFGLVTCGGCLAVGTGNLLTREYRSFFRHTHVSPVRSRN